MPAQPVEAAAGLNLAAASSAAAAAGRVGHGVQKQTGPSKCYGVWCGLLFMVIVFFFLTNLAKVALSFFCLY
jgi:uncharacterized integral membrane protein